MDDKTLLERAAKAADEAEDDGIMGLLHEDDLIAAKWLRAMSAALQSGDRG